MGLVELRNNLNTPLFTEESDDEKDEYFSNLEIRDWHTFKIPVSYDYAKGHEEFFTITTKEEKTETGNIYHVIKEVVYTNEGSEGYLYLNTPLSEEEIETFYKKYNQRGFLLEVMHIVYRK